jgi:hypothetical protein
MQDHAGYLAVAGDINDESFVWSCRVSRHHKYSSTDRVSQGDKLGYAEYYSASNTFEARLNTIEYHGLE